MTQGRGASVGDYRAPLFFAWQLTNRCGARCLHCCEESGPDKAWPDELPVERALAIAREIVSLKIPYVAFGGGEPMQAAPFWPLMEILREGGVEVKLETNGLVIDDRAADRLKAMETACIQISIDGPDAATHEKVRPGGDFAGAVAALKRLARRGLAPELVFVPNRLNVDSAAAVYDLAVSVGARTFVTGPMMRLGRAAASWDSLAASPADWQRCAEALKKAAEKHNDKVKLSIYPWGIQQEMLARLESPQAMLLAVPNGKVKLLNALPFAVGDLSRQSVAEAWEGVRRGWSDPSVRDFIVKAQKDPALLSHANECWDLGTATAVPD